KPTPEKQQPPCQQHVKLFNSAAWKPVPAEWIAALSPRARAVGLGAQEYMSTGQKQLDPCCFPRREILPLMLKACGHAPLEELARAYQRGLARGQLPFLFDKPGKPQGPYSDKFWPSYLYVEIGRHYGGVAPPGYRVPSQARNHHSEPRHFDTAAAAP